MCKIADKDIVSLVPSSRCNQGASRAPTIETIYIIPEIVLML